MSCPTIEGAVQLGEYGQVLHFNVGEDILGTIVSLVFSAPNKPDVIKTALDGVVVATSDLVLPSFETYLANEYVEYTVEDGLFDTKGKWKIRLVVEYVSPSRIRKTPFVTMEVTY